MSKFKAGDLIQVKGDSDVQLRVLFVGQSKYFVRYYDGREGDSLIEVVDRHHELATEPNDFIKEIENADRD